MSWLLDRNVPPHVVQRLLGHESIITTVDTYGHLMPDARRAAAAAVSELFALKSAAPPIEGAAEAVVAIEA